MSEQQPRTQSESADSNTEASKENNNYGFQPVEEEPKVSEKQKDPDTPLCPVLREEINKLLCRYPELTLRTSQATMLQLEQYGEKELKNILQNCRNDLQAIRGTPSADFAIGVGTLPVDRWCGVEGYTERCLHDRELKRDVEHEMTLVLGGGSNRINILFRLMNNLYACLFQPDMPYNVGEMYDMEEEGEESPYVKRVDPPANDEHEEEQAKRQHKRARTERGENQTSH
jgi:hypothetical protein